MVACVTRAGGVVHLLKMGSCAATPLASHSSRADDTETMQFRTCWSKALGFNFRYFTRSAKRRAVHIPWPRAWTQPALML